MAGNLPIARVRPDNGLVPALGRMTRRASLGQGAYVLIVTVAAVVGFATGSTAIIVLAALLALPSSILAVSGCYMVTTTGDPAAWFTVTTNAVGILALIVAAGLNVVILRGLITTYRTRRQTPGH